MLVFGIILAFLLLLGFTRVGVRVSRDTEGRTRFFLRIGFLRINILKLLDKAAKKPEKKREAPKKAEDAAKKRFSWDMVKPLLEAGGKLLSALRKSVRIDRLMLRITVGGDDPCDAALLYGRLHMVWCAAQPFLLNTFRVKKRDVDIGLNYDLEKTQWSGDFAATVSIGRMMGITVSLLGLLIRLTRKSNPEPINASK